MPIGAWVLVGIIAVSIACGAVSIAMEVDKKSACIIIVVAVAIIAAIIGFGFWYYGNTAAGQRAMVDQRSNMQNGLERTVTVYTASGDVIAKYEGLIDLEANEGGYVKFDFEGKRYIYYNCFVESIADIPQD